MVLLHRKGLYAERLHHGGRLLAGSGRGVDTAVEREASGRVIRKIKEAVPRRYRFDRGDNSVKRGRKVFR